MSWVVASEGDNTLRCPHCRTVVGTFRLCPPEQSEALQPRRRPARKVQIEPLLKSSVRRDLSGAFGRLTEPDGSNGGPAKFACFICGSVLICDFTLPDMVD